MNRGRPQRAGFPRIRDQGAENLVNLLTICHDGRSGRSEIPLQHDARWRDRTEQMQRLRPDFSQIEWPTFRRTLTQIGQHETADLRRFQRVSLRRQDIGSPSLLL